MSQTFHVTGELIDHHLVKLDERIPLPAGKVRLVVEELATRQPANLTDFEDALRTRQAARNHIPRSKDEVDAFLASERATWDREQ